MLQSHCIQWRWVVVLLLHIVWFMIWAQAFSLNIILIAMTRITLNSTAHHTTSTSGEFTWSEIDKGIILSAYFYIYGLIQIVGGYCVYKLNAKHILSVVLFVSSLLMLLTPAAAHASLLMFVVVRMLLGAVHGFAYATVMSLMSKWYIRSEMIRCSEFIWSAEQVAPLITTPLGAYLSEHHIFQGTWKSVVLLAN